MVKTKGDENAGNIDIVLSSMEPMCVYRPCDLVSITNLSNKEINRLLRKLTKGMMVDVIEDNEYRRKKLYQTKQNRLF